MKISEHFSDIEFFSPDVYEEIIAAGHEPCWHIDPVLVLRLEIIRKELEDKFPDVTINITHTQNGTNGFRPYKQNLLAGGKEYSFHQEGKAVDFIAMAGGRMIPVETVQKVIRENFDTGGLGKGSTFTHIDVRNSNKLVEWGYGR